MRAITLATALVCAAALATGLPGTAAAQAPAEVQYRPANPRVLVAGDSLEVGTAPLLRELLPSIPLTVDAVGGRYSDAGLDVLRELLEPSHEVLVFDLGTNDYTGAPEGLTAVLSQARVLAGQRCMVVATITKPPQNGISVDGMNAAIKAFAASAPAVRLVDWHATTEADPGLLSDGVHGTGEGYALRASMIADGIRACLSDGVGKPPPGDMGRPPRARIPKAPLPPLPLAAMRRPLSALHTLLGAGPRVLATAVSEARDAVSPETPETVLGG